MGLKKLPNSLTDEELLDLLSNKQEDSSNNTVIEYKNDVLTFMSVFNIKPGEFKVPPLVLKELYRIWSKDPVTPNVFSREINSYIPLVKSNSHTFYLINRETLDISETAYKALINKSVKATRSPAYRKHYERFLSRFCIKSGDYYIEHYVLYKLYRQWIYETNYKPMSQIKFFRFCCLYFKHKRNAESRMQWFAVDLGVLNVTMGKLKILRDEYKKELKEKRKKANKKIKS